ELNAWERAGADASSAGMVDAGFENQKELTKMQLDNQKEIAEMQNETQKEIAGIQSATSRQNTKDQVYAQNEMLEAPAIKIVDHLHTKDERLYACLDRKSGSAGMPRPISYAVFCLKKKKTDVSSLRAEFQGRPIKVVCSDLQEAEHTLVTLISIPC